MPDPTFVNYYQRELAYLRALAQEFVQAHPELAYTVAERGTDPAAERFFEGASLITARLRQRVEDDYPEVVHPLFARLWPQYLRPIPAATLLRFTVLPNAVQGTQLVPRGTVVFSRPTEATPSCPFQTTSEIGLVPALIEEAALVRPQPGDLQLRLRFDAGAGSLGQAKPKRLRVQFVGDDEVRYGLFAWVCHARGLSVLDADDKTCMELPASAIRPLGLTPEEALGPGLPTPLPGIDLLRDYFILPEKYLGIEVQGLDAAPKDADLAKFSLVFHLGPLPDPGFRIGAEDVALGCVPVINLSETFKLEVSVAPGVHRFRLEVPAEGVVHGIERVSCLDAGRREWMDIAPLVQLGVARPGTEGQAEHLRYQLVRRLEGITGVQSYLAITDPEGRPTPPPERLQVWLSRTDGPVPLRLGAGTIDQPGARSPAFATHTNLLPVLRGEDIRLERDRLWQLLAQFLIHPAELASLAGLQTLLHETRGDRPGTAPLLKEVTCRETGTLYRRTVVPLRRIEIVVDGSTFAGPGHIYLFGTVVSQLYAQAPGSTVINDVTVRDESGAVRFSFRPWAGRGSGG